MLLLGKEQALDSVQLDSLSLTRIQEWDEAEEDAFEVANTPEQPILTSWIDIKKRIGRPRNRFIKTVYGKKKRGEKKGKGKGRGKGKEKIKTNISLLV